MLPSRRRRRTNAPPSAPPRAASKRTQAELCVSDLRDKTGIPQAMADSLVCLILGESPPPYRDERRESRPVADQRHCPSLGERCEANAILAVLRGYRLPNLRRWHGLVAVDDS